MRRTPVTNDPGISEIQTLPFGPDFQMQLMRMLCEDPAFAHAVMPHLRPEYFTVEVLVWAYRRLQEYVQEYGNVPRIAVLREMTKHVDPQAQMIYQLTLDRVASEVLADGPWIQDQVLEFVRRSLFVRSFRESRDLYNGGQVNQAYDLMAQRMEEIRTATYEIVDRTWFFEDFGVRQGRRLRSSPEEEAVPSGFPWLDNILRGGLSLGELGIWVAYAKHGKSTMLVQHGVAATRRGWKNALHVVLEGSRAQVEDRYEAAFLMDAYGQVRRGDIDSDKYTDLLKDYHLLQKRLVIRGLVERWDYTIEDVHAEMRTLERDYHWRPDLVIVDYGDLLRGRGKSYVNDTAEQKAVFRDLKNLANRGYAVWTACQAQRPEKGADEKPHLINSNMIADAYEKVRVADFIGSINWTNLEKDESVARLYAELYRDNASLDWITIRADWAKMILRQEKGLTSPAVNEAAPPVLGYTKTQARAPV